MYTESCTEGKWLILAIRYSVGGKSDGKVGCNVKGSMAGTVCVKM